MASRNRTLRLAEEDIDRLLSAVVSIPTTATLPLDTIICADMVEACQALAPQSVDLLILDPPYHLRKQYAESTFAMQSAQAYQQQFAQWLDSTLPALKPDATVYICSEWRTSALIYPLIEERLIIRNRITWEREKGRGAKVNWKNNSEDIWFCTCSADYRFYADRVKLRRPVLAPYRDHAARPKDWHIGTQGAYRDTAPSNLWTDVTVPFWSMAENTDHPT